MRTCADRAGLGSLRVVLPAAGIVFATVEEQVVERLLAEARRAGWAVVVESCSAALRARIDVFGAEPDALPLMRGLKARFDPDRVLSPGRMVGRI